MVRASLVARDDNTRWLRQELCQFSTDYRAFLMKSGHIFGSTALLLLKITNKNKAQDEPCQPYTIIFRLYLYTLLARKLV